MKQDKMISQQRVLNTCSLAGIGRCRAAGAARMLLVVFTGALLAGCGAFGIGPFPAPGSTDIRTAEAAFLAGNYSKAREVFGRLARHARSGEIRRLAGYGLGCTDMVLAKDATAFGASLESFLQTISAPAARFGNENPALLARALSHGLTLARAEQASVSGRLSALAVKEKTWEKERATMTGLIKTLQHQISVLERIDRERQEKRAIQ